MKEDKAIIYRLLVLTINVRLACRYSHLLRHPIIFLLFHQRCCVSAERFIQTS